ncbi:2-isopropylmalate synthase [Photobacterium salinisoli]|uniref:2-isopropylmalate synthase n=1 Tax=Photobacterium salinisoli TaxID=1616783 RepID=UPI000EA36AF5|nr:2-isopropylmalate synthase [Photobacterium salinisoli]
MLNPAKKYIPASVIDFPQRSWPSQKLVQAPRWCSTDLRDGNQALVNPMDFDKKARFFDHLIQCGFKEIEVAFPSASTIDYDFVRYLIEQRKIPQDVWIQVITQSRPELIEKTMSSLRGAPRAIVHLYNATAPVFREIVFKKSKEETLNMAVSGVKQIRQLCEENTETDWVLEYSPETFCFTEFEYALAICEAVRDAWQPDEKRPLILNLPTTVEVNTPNVYADQIEKFIHSFSDLRHVTISIHPHNDRGTGVAAAELAMLAGAQRVEGCLFGNGERTGNVDIVTLALNLYTQGITPHLDFSDIRASVEIVEECNALPVHPRHPYAGEMVFTAFSGSHQDAIKKGFDARANEPSERWQVPYLPIDPKDVGCDYEAVIRVNSQSGKSGAAWLIEKNHGLKLPRNLQIDFSQQVQRCSEQHGLELSLAEIWTLFRRHYGMAPYNSMLLLDYESKPEGAEQSITARVRYHNQVIKVQGRCNGLLSALICGLERILDIPIAIRHYSEHTLGKTTHSRAVSYIECHSFQSGCYFGVAIENDTSRASLQATLNAVSNLLAESEIQIFPTGKTEYLDSVESDE